MSDVNADQKRVAAFRDSAKGLLAEYSERYKEDATFVEQFERKVTDTLVECSEYLSSRTVDRLWEYVQALDADVVVTVANGSLTAGIVTTARLSVALDALAGALNEMI